MRDGDILPDVVVKGGSDGYRFEKFNPRDAHIMNEGELRKLRAVIFQKVLRLILQLTPILPMRSRVLSKSKCWDSPEDMFK